MNFAAILVKFKHVKAILSSWEKLGYFNCADIYVHFVHVLHQLYYMCVPCSTNSVIRYSLDTVSFSGQHINCWSHLVGHYVLPLLWYTSVMMNLLACNPSLKEITWVIWASKPIAYKSCKRILAHVSLIHTCIVLHYYNYKIHSAVGHLYKRGAISTTSYVGIAGAPTLANIDLTKIAKYLKNSQIARSINYSLLAMK